MRRHAYPPNLTDDFPNPVGLDGTFCQLHFGFLPANFGKTEKCHTRACASDIKFWRQYGLCTVKCGEATFMSETRFVPKLLIR